MHETISSRRLGGAWCATNGTTPRRYGANRSQHQRVQNFAFGTMASTEGETPRGAGRSRRESTDVWPVADIRAHSLRFSLSPLESFHQWSSACITPGGEELRYLKFFLRAQSKGQPYSYDPDECAFVVASLRKTLRTNAGALSGFWLGYTLKEQLADARGIALLQEWVSEHGGPTWWDEQWAPLVRKCAAPGALVGDGKDGSPRTYFTMASGPRRRRKMRLGVLSCLRCSARVQPSAA